MQASVLAAAAAQQPLGGGNEVFSSWKPAAFGRGLPLYPRKKEGAPALAPQEPRRKNGYDFFIVELPNLGVSLYGFPQFWQIYVIDIFEGERCLKSP